VTFDVTNSGTAPVPLAVELKQINKWFGPVHANKNVNLDVERGQIHAIIGENGAGKSTLVSILYGFHKSDSGSISINGNQVTINEPATALASGIAMVHQHFMLVQNFTVLENVILGNEGSGDIIKASSSARLKLEELINRFGLSIDLDARIEDLPVGIQQRVEILKALYRGARVLILDEPTGVLTPQETDQLFEILRTLKSKSVTILFITHKLKEVMAIADCVSVMRSGEIVAHRDVADTSPPELAELMVGRKVLLRVSRSRANPGKTVLRLTDVSLQQTQGTVGLRDISLTVREGEIVGVAGVSGNGQSELLEIVSGIATPDSGHIEVCGKLVDSLTPTDPRALRKLGVAHVPEDRHRRGLVLPFSAAESSILGYDDLNLSPRSQNGWFLDPSQVAADCASLMDRFDVRPAEPSLHCQNVSGGNQQKLGVAREVSKEPKLLLVGQPTRGVDIGAIEFIHRHLIELRDRGCAVLLVSAELDEIFGLSDRIIVMNAGRITGEVASEDANETDIGLMMAGINTGKDQTEARL